jgi:hypothetical protein
MAASAAVLETERGYRDKYGDITLARRLLSRCFAEVVGIYWVHDKTA